MELKERILALDVGDKRIGVAISDPFGLFATPLGVVLNDEHAYEKIENHLKAYNIKKIVTGIPYNMDGSTGIQAKKTMEFMKRFENLYEIIYKDERLTSFEAEEILKKQKKKYTKNKGMVDEVAACLILQSYLGEQK